MPIRFLSVVFALLVCTKTCSSSTTSNSEAPWQWKESRTSIVEEATYGDMPATVFSPTGRLYSVESNVKLASSSGNLILAVNCNDGIVILSTMILSPYLNETLFLVDKQPFQYITELSPNLMGATAGNGIDNAVFLNTMHKTCQHLLQQGSDENCALLARQLADQLQVPTQTLGKSKLLAVRVGINYCSHLHNHVSHCRILFLIRLIHFTCRVLESLWAIKNCGDSIQRDSFGNAKLSRVENMVIRQNENCIRDYLMVGKKFVVS